jgi:hypothetical protein
VRAQSRASHVLPNRKIWEALIPEVLDFMVSAEGMPSANNINDLNCQTILTAHFDTQRIFPALSNLIVVCDDGNATIKISLERVNRHGQSSAKLPDGTLLVRRSRQAFLDSARTLISAGCDPDIWLEGWRPGSTSFDLRARLGIAGGLTVDETRTVFAPWKPFSPSAVAPQTLQDA